MLAWVSLVHAGTWLPAALSQHLQEEIGISLAEQDLLKQLDVAGGQLKLVDLARRVFLSKAGVTKMMDRLETAGLVVRERSTTDRRVINARLTPTGKRTVAKSRQLLLAWAKTNFADHLTEAELNALQAALQKLIEGHGRWQDQLAHLRGDDSVTNSPTAAR